MAPLSLSELLDVAIGTPEVGAVNFIALHGLLRAMLRHLGLQHLPAAERAPAPAPGEQPPERGQQPAPGTASGSAASDMGQMKEKTEAKDSDGSEDLLKEISGVKMTQSHMGEDIQMIKAMLGLADGRDAAGQQQGHRDWASSDSDVEAGGGQPAATESPESGEVTQRGGSSRVPAGGLGTQPAPRTSKGTPGTQPGFQGMQAGMQRAPATPEKWAGAALDQTRMSDASATTPRTQLGVPDTQATMPGIQPGSPGTQATTLGTQPGSSGTQATSLESPGTIPGMQPASASTPATTPGAQPGSPSTPATTPGAQPGSPSTPATTPGTQPGSPSTPATTLGTQPGSPSTLATTPGTQPAPPWSRGGRGVQPSSPSTGPSLPGAQTVPAEATPGALGTLADATRPKGRGEALPGVQVPQAAHPAVQPLSPATQGPEMSSDTDIGSTSPAQELAVPGGSSGSSSSSSRAVGLAEVLQQVEQLSHLCAALQEQVAQLEATKSDHTEVEELRLLFLEGDQESIASALADLRGRVSSLQGLASDLHGEKEKIKRLQDALGKLGVAGANWKADGSLQLGSMLELKRELKELREQQDMAKATLEQLVANTANRLQEQLDELRSMTGGAVAAVSPASSPGGAELGHAEAQAACPVCSTDVGAQLGLLLQRYEQLQELVDSVLSQQAMGKVARQLPGRRQQDEELLKHIQATIVQVQGDCEKLSSVTGNLMDGHHQKQKDIEALFHSLERLEKEKADKEELVLEIDVKADRAALAGKVSCTQFDAAMEQLNKMIEDMLSKVTGQEQDWHQIQQKLIEEMDSKLDRLELAPLRQQLEEHWGSILKQLKEKTPQAEADDAAGIRKQLLAHFHCVSCDRPLRMLVPGPHIVAIPAMPPLPSRLSVRSHAIFEPEQLRQHGRREQAAECGYLRVPRRCGGQHTLTHPLQRCPRLQHLPPCTPGQLRPRAGLSVKHDEMELLGQDGHIYRGRRDARLPALVGKEGLLRDKPKLSPRQCGTQDTSLLPLRPQSAVSSLGQRGTPRPQEHRPASSHGHLPRGPGLPPPLWPPQDGRETPAAQRGQGSSAESPPWAPGGGSGQEQ